MFIKNLKNNSNTYKCGKTMGNFLIKEGFPVLSKDGNLIVFAYTERLKKVLAHLPLHLKIMRKLRIING